MPLGLQECELPSARRLSRKGVRSEGRAGEPRCPRVTAASGLACARNTHCCVIAILPPAVLYRLPSWSGKLVSPGYGSHRLTPLGLFPAAVMAANQTRIASYVELGGFVSQNSTSASGSSVFGIPNLLRRAVGCPIILGKSFRESPRSTRRTGGQGGEARNLPIGLVVSAGIPSIKEFPPSTSFPPCGFCILFQALDLAGESASFVAAAPPIFGLKALSSKDIDIPRWLCFVKLGRRFAVEEAVVWSRQ